MLSSIRSWWKSRGGDPVGHGIDYHGIFEPNGDKITGMVATALGRNDRPPTTIAVHRLAELIGSTDACEQCEAGWRFVVEVSDRVTPQDILRDRIHVFAVDHLGTRSQLQMPGAVQLEYVRDGMGGASEAELVIDFAQGGNSPQYTREGWSHIERDHTWTLGTESVVEIPIKYPGAKYTLEMMVWGFIVPEKLTAQGLSVFIGDMQIGKFYVEGAGGRQSLLECHISRELAEADKLTIRLEHPDAARPVDLGVAEDYRLLALGFRRMRLKRYYETPDRPQDT